MLRDSYNCFHHFKIIKSVLDAFVSRGERKKEQIATLDIRSMGLYNQITLVWFVLLLIIDDPLLL